MRIALIVALFPPKWLAGTEIASYNIAKTLAKKGHEIHVITYLDAGFQKKEIRDNFCIHRIYLKKIRFIGTISFWYNTFLEIKKINPDLIHVQAISAAIPGLFTKIVLKKPYVVWGQGSDVYLPSRFTKLTSKIVLQNASTIIALSEDMRTKMCKICKRKDIVILPNGIEIENFKNIRSQKQQKKIEKSILFVGTLRPVKGVKYLIQAMRFINEKSPNTNLIIIGDGPDRNELEALVHEFNLEACTHFIGKVSNQEIPEYMAQADVFALPSLSEGFPLVIAEAMASGLPIVTTNVGGLPELIKNGENGFVVDSRSPRALAEKILLLLDDINLYKKISNTNKENAKNYSWDGIVKKLENIYRKICL